MDVPTAFGGDEAAAIAALRDAYAALNRGDVPGYMAIFDPQIEWIESAEFSGGTTRGLAAVHAHVAHHRGSWAAGRCDAERLVAVGNRLIQFVSVRVMLKGETEWREGRLAEVYTFREGRVTQVRLFGDPQEAVEWAARGAAA